ncbi:MAG: asparagine--tRNA ligase [Candidatus Heimdallarchaeota archaeon]|nr:asparagine--tRNA ligase [Candidatus Heimdallarchaeota archaeon]MDH5644637.1 asparagine--tRNA ligase [Candidatus Heimdallarchaeota archaeon]
MINKISELSDLIGKEVKIESWVLNIRRQGKKLCFLSLYDGTAELQATVKLNNVGEDNFAITNDIYRGASVSLIGTVVEDTRSVGGIELQVSKVHIIHPSLETFDQEITPESGADVRLTKRHIVIRGPKSASVLRLKSHVIKYLREYFYSRGLEEVVPPLIVEAQAEGGSELFEIKYFDTHAYLTQSSQLYLEAAIYSLRDVFCILPSFRAEKSRTRRHLAEYTHVETEHAYMDFSGLLDFLEDMIIHVITQVRKYDSDILELWERKLDIPEKPFPRVNYNDALKILKENYDIDIPHGEDISDAPERQLVEHFGKPIILQNFPKKMKPFYHKIDPDDPNITKSADFLFPICGELIGCGERETDIDSMLKRMGQMNPPVDPEHYYWYLDLRRYGSVPHSGFGMGLERLVQWLLDLEHIRDTTLFPRTLNRLSP